MKRGDFIWVERGSAKVGAMVTLASPNERSLMVMFDGMFCGYVGVMPLLRDDDGVYRDLLRYEQVAITDRGPEFTCPDCHRTSYNPEDARNRYCGNCHEFKEGEAGV
jgi:hypothetical protein